MSLLNISAKLDQYVIQNYSNPLNVNMADVPFDDSNKDTWISIRFNPTGANLIGLDGTSQGRQELSGLYTVRCYANYRKTSLSIADEVKLLLDGLQIDSLYLENGEPTPPIELDGNIWETTLNFRLTES